MNRKRLVVVIPVHNEAANIGPLAERLQAAAAHLPAWDTELLFVDDGSTDDSIRRLDELRDRGLPVGYLALSRNFGQQAALQAGLDAADGDAAITMDADLQHPPEEIGRMIEAHESGADVVQMVRERAADGQKGFFSRLFYRIFKLAAHTEIVPDAADFRLLSRRVLEVLRRIPEREKFLRALIPSLGFRQVVLPFTEGPRAGGMPSYGFRQSLRLAGRALFDFSTVPLHFVFWFGTGLALISFVFGVGHVLWKLIAWQKVVPGFTDLIVAILFLSGCILALMGIISRYLILTLEQLRGRPAFIIARRVPGGVLPADAKKP
jgi:polyisoprenyl-phosphate glycosyltransferase